MLGQNQDRTPEANLLPPDVGELSELQYGGVTFGDAGESASNLYADARRTLYPFVADGVDIWSVAAESARPKFESADGKVTVADVGAGNGFFFRDYLFPRYGEQCEYVGINNHKGHTNIAQAITQTSAEQADTTMPARYLTADAHELPFDDNSVSVVVKNFLDYHLDDPAKSMAECYRVLEPGGMFIDSCRYVDNLERLWRLGGFMVDEVNRQEQRYGSDAFPRPPRFYPSCDVPRMKQLAQEAGLQPLSEYEQNTCLEIPLLPREDGVRPGFWQLRQALFGFQTVTRNEAGELMSGEAMAEVVDNKLWALFNLEIQLKRSLGKAAVFGDTVHQATTAWIKPRLSVVTL